MPSPDNMESLAQQALDGANVLASTLRSMGEPQPSFSADGPIHVLPSKAPEAAIKARMSIIEACFKLYHLVAGPSDLLPSMQADVRTGTLRLGETFPHGSRG